MGGAVVAAVVTAVQLKGIIVVVVVFAFIRHSIAEVVGVIAVATAATIVGSDSQGIVKRVINRVDPITRLSLGVA